MADIITTAGDVANWEEAIWICGETLFKKGYINDYTFTHKCIEREKKYPTGLPLEIPVAIPHSNAESLKEDCICFLKLKNPVEFNCMDDPSKSIKVKLIFNIAIKDPDKHLELLKRVINKFQTKDFLEKCLQLSETDITNYLNLELNQEIR